MIYLIQYVELTFVLCRNNLFEIDNFEGNLP